MPDPTITHKAPFQAAEYIKLVNGVVREVHDIVSVDVRTPAELINIQIPLLYAIPVPVVMPVVGFRHINPSTENAHPPVPLPATAHVLFA